MPDTDSPHRFRPCPVPRRLVAMVYDGLIVIAVWMVGAAIVVVAAGGRIESGNLLFQGWLMLLAFVYFHVSWSRAGQTLGMRAWRIRLDPGAGPMTPVRSLLRFAGGIASVVTLGTGFVWALARTDRRGWPDLISGTRLVVDNASR